MVRRPGWLPPLCDGERVFADRLDMVSLQSNVQTTSDSKALTLRFPVQYFQIG